MSKFKVQMPKGGREPEALAEATFEVGGWRQEKCQKVKAGG